MLTNGNLNNRRGGRWILEEVVDGILLLPLQSNFVVQMRTTDQPRVPRATDDVSPFDSLSLSHKSFREVCIERLISIPVVNFDRETIACISPSEAYLPVTRRPHRRTRIIDDIEPFMELHHL